MSCNLRPTISRRLLFVLISRDQSHVLIQITRLVACRRSQVVRHVDEYNFSRRSNI
ncbi:hypothetical protein YC2023_050143 [Brassica napus]